MENIINDLLFKTDAIKTCPQDKPFFYTSGKIGPYYINTHYLFGSAENADKFLSDMEKYKKDLLEFPGKLLHDVKNQYESNDIYKKVSDLIVSKIKTYDFDYISGGERRDFFFSVIAAYLLNKPHISIMKDKTVIVSDKGINKSYFPQDGELKGKKVLHIADLVTEASSYIRAWLPAIEKTGAEIEHTVCIVDRMQGGREILKNRDIELFSFTSVNNDLFLYARDNGYINEYQYLMISDFIEDPDEFMYNFFDKNAGFLDEKIKEGGKNKQRALLCIENNFHKR